MKFYVRRSRGSEIGGPFAIEEINQMVRQKRLKFRSLAVADAGQGLSAVQTTPLEKWIKVADIPGYEPNPAAERNCLLIALAILIAVAVIVVIGLIKFSDILHRIH